MALLSFFSLVARAKPPNLTGSLSLWVIPTLTQTFIASFYLFLLLFLPLQNLSLFRSASLFSARHQFSRPPLTQPQPHTSDKSAGSTILLTNQTTPDEEILLKVSGSFLLAQLWRLFPTRLLRIQDSRDHLPKRRIEYSLNAGVTNTCTTGRQSELYRSTRFTTGLRLVNSIRKPGTLAVPKNICTLILAVGSRYLNT